MHRPASLTPSRRITATVLCVVLLVAAACSSDDDAAESISTQEPTATSVPAEADPTTVPEQTDAPQVTDDETAAVEETVEEAPAEEPAPVDEAPAEEPTDTEPGVTSTFVAEVWADNWFALYVNGELVGEDSVPITTERSFNAETITFEATYPLTIAIEAKDFKETDSGIEYIGLNNQQMGDGGLIAQITDTGSGELVAVSDGSWSSLVIHRAPLNTECERDPDPDTTCQFESTEAPDGWTGVAFDDSAWSAATVWTAADVDPKIGYDEITWAASAALVWGSDLEVDNTVLLRHVVAG